jgi:EmrB/QacA subfamily drug resistance transporter
MPALGWEYGCRVDRRWLVLSAVSIGTFMATLDGSIVNIALPSIGRAFGIDLATVEWVVLAYLLVVGSLLLPFGRLGEVVSFRYVYLAGFAVFTVASVLCGAAPGIGALIGFRALQGVGAAMLMAMGPAIVARTFGPGGRGRALGLNAISVSIGLSLGPALGGLLTELASWRAIFLINAPIGLVAIVWAARVLPMDRPGRRDPFDIPGAALVSTGLLALLLALNQGGAWGWTSPATVGLLLVAAGLGAAFLAVERRRAAPLMDLGLFGIRAFSAGLASVFVAFAGLFTATFLLPFMLQEGSGIGPLEAGLLITPIPIAAAVVAPFSGALSDRIGSRLPASLGIALLAVGLLSLTTLPPTFDPLDLTWRLVLIGAGQGLFMSPNSSAVLGAVPRLRLGSASGMVAETRVVGQSLGIVVSAAVVAARLPVHLASLGGVGATDALSEAFVAATHDAFVVAALICSVGIVTSLVRGPAPGVGVAEMATPGVTSPPDAVGR